MNITPKISFILFFLSITCLAQGQETAALEADRPDQTESASTVPTGMFQVETGFSYQKENRSSTSYLAPTVLMKYGLNENF